MFKINHRFLNILVNNVKIHRYKHKENHWVMKQLFLYQLNTRLNQIIRSFSLYRRKTKLEPLEP